VHFSSDEAMNIYWYWELGASKVMLADVLVLAQTIRPMASLYYLPLFHMFGFNPRPYTVVRLALLLLDSLDEQTGRLGSATGRSSAWTRIASSPCYALGLFPDCRH